MPAPTCLVTLWQFDSVGRAQKIGMQGTRGLFPPALLMWNVQLHRGVYLEGAYSDNTPNCARLALARALITLTRSVLTSK